MTIWAGGFLVLCLRLLLDLCGLRRFQKRAREPRDREWRAAIRDAARDVGVRRPVRLLLLPGLPTPMTWGSMNPVVLLPRTAETWSADRRRVVLQHELVHLRRHDWLFLVLGRFTCAVYWFNPLVWLAARCLARQREYACDESVVSLGTRPSDYARHLVDIARSLGRNARPAPATALNMASGHSLERRVRALLDPVDPRGLRPARGTIFPTILVAPGLLLWLASWTPWSDPAPARYTEAQAVEFMRDRDWPRAVEALRQVVAERPDLAAAWFDLGYALHHTGDLDAALPAHLQAAATAGKRSVRAAALYNAACVHSLEARPGQAIRLLRLSFRCGYSDLGHLVKDPDFVPLWKEADFLDLLVQRFPGKSSMLVRIAGQRSRASASATLAGS